METDAGTRDAIGNTPPVSGELPDATLALHALLTSYADTLEMLNKARTFLWTRFEKPRVLRWLPVPAPRRVVRALIVRHVHQCVDALKCGVIRNSALSDDAVESSRDLEMLQQFEQSLRNRVRLSLIWPLPLLGVLFVAFILASIYHAGYRTLLGDLTTAALNLNRTAAIAAIESAHRLALAGHEGAKHNYLYDIQFFASAAMIVAWAAVLVIVPFLPTAAIYRRTKAQWAAVEADALAAVGARTGRGIEIDLVARLLLFPAVAVSSYSAFLYGAIQNDTVLLVAGAICAVLIVFASLELRFRYTERCRRIESGHRPITQMALSLLVVLSLGLFVYLPYEAHKRTTREDRWTLDVVQSPAMLNEYATGWLYDQLYFIITAVQPNADCSDQHGPLIDNPQFLRFDLETWSTVDQFVTPDVATGLLLRHWSVVDKHGNPTNNLLLHNKCGQGTDAISQPIIPGSHTKTMVVVSAPKNAVCLQLKVPGYHAVWQWRIPPISHCPS